MEQMFRRTAQQVLDQFGVTRQGLTTEQVEKQRATYGENALTEGQKKGPLVVFLEQFKDLLVIILIIAAADLRSLRQWGEHHRHLRRADPQRHPRAPSSTSRRKNRWRASRPCPPPPPRCMRDGERVEIPSSRGGPRRHRAAGGRRPGRRRRPHSGELLAARSTRAPSPARARAWTRPPTSSMRTRSPWATRRTWCSPARW